MAKITTPSYITGISGKVCRHEADEYRTNSCSGKIVLSKKCNPYTGEPTAQQMEVREKFKSRVAVTQQWLRDNRPSTENPKGTALYQEAIRIKKENKLDNVQAAISMYQLFTDPWTIKLPSEGGTKQNPDGSAGSGDNSAGSGGNTDAPDTENGGGGTTQEPSEGGSDSAGGSEYE